MRANDPKDTQKVAEILDRPQVKIGKPRKIVTSMRAKVAFPATGGFSQGAGGNFYSPELSSDFLELPQSIDEQRNYYRLFYRTEPFVGQAVDLRTELPLSKLRLGMPKAKNKVLARKALEFCEKWAKKIGLLHRLIEIVHEYNLLGEVFIFVEDNTPDMPRDLVEEPVREIDAGGNLTERWVRRPDGDDRAVTWLKKNFHGWTALRVLPPEQVHMEAFPFTDEKIFELIPDSKTKNLVGQADQGDMRARRVVESMPPEIVEAIREGRNIPLNTDPEAGSFVYYMANKRSQYEPRGQSPLERCIRTLVFRDKLRQAQTSIASRHMTPYRLVWGEDLNAEQVEELRAQVDLALADPDFSIITNFQVNWEEKGGGMENRLMDLTSEYELTDRQMYAGLGVTESLLSGEGSYSGDKINLEVINVRFMLLREILQDLVESFFFKPMCARMGFVEEDEAGNIEVLVPKLTFTRLALRDNNDTYEALFNLYQKGSLDIDVILDLLNIDPETTRAKLERDVFTLQDPVFNELIRNIYNSVAQKIVDGTDITEKLAEHLRLKYEAPKGEDRFGG